MSRGNAKTGRTSCMGFIRGYLLRGPPLLRMVGEERRGEAEREGELGVERMDGEEERNDGDGVERTVGLDERKLGEGDGRGGLTLGEERNDGELKLGEGDDRTVGDG